MGNGFTLKMDVLGSDALLRKLDRTQTSFANLTFQTVIDTAQEVCDRAKSLVPVETGALRDSIEVQLDSDSDGAYQVSVGSTLDYALYVEFGHFTRPGENRRWVQAQPFLYPAFREQEAEYSNAFKANINQIQDIGDIPSPIEPSGDLSTATVKVSKSIRTSRSISKVRSVKGSRTRKLFDKKLRSAKRTYKRLLRNIKLARRVLKRTTKPIRRIISKILKKQKAKLIKNIKESQRKHKIERQKRRMRFQRQVIKFVRVQTRKIIRSVTKKRKKH